ncbi:hypothetical protein LNQ52_29140 [Klebsiella pneumoniae subsp. pneumoniae]|nr:hypothetical protein [Klebsiella pneumoniae subsp. pneumoniae]
MACWSSPRINLKDAGAMRVVKQMGPAILGVSVSQISLIINHHFRLIPRVGPRCRGCVMPTA